MKNTSDRFRLHWATYMDNNSIGNAYGYRVHNETLRKYVSEIADITQDAKDALLIMSPEFYRSRVDGKYNWLFTMFEAETLPPIWVEKIQKADFLLMPSTWCKGLFSKYFDSDRIFVINHGVTTDFKFKKRKFPHDRPFRFLWVGAPNPRKGWEEVIAIWQKVGFQNARGVELYIKTTRYPKVERRGNVILDGRDLSKKDLIKLYHSAHCFVFPTRGEGFGLTLAEAMRTGLPCISTYYSGVTDFFDEKVGYPVGYDILPVDVKKPDGTVIDTVEGAFPKVEEIIEQMIEVVSDYRRASKKGEMASARIRSKFTWPLAARNLVDTMRSQTC